MAKYLKISPKNKSLFFTLFALFLIVLLIFIVNNTKNKQELATNLKTLTLTDEEKEIIANIKRGTPYKNCDPKPIDGKVEVNFIDNDQFFSEKEAEKIVKSFKYPVSIPQRTSFETEIFLFDLKEKLPIYDNSNKPVMPILENLFKGIPEISTFDFLPLKENPAKSKITIIFKYQMPPAMAEKIIQKKYSNAVILFSNGDPHHKNNPISFRLNVEKGKEREIVAFLRKNDKIKHVQRAFTSCPVP